MRRLSFAIAVLVAVSTARAQNLLHNPSLEGQGGFAIPPGSCSPGNDWFWQYQCIPEIEPPTWWFPFWSESPTPDDPEVNYRRPEFRVYAWPDAPHYAYDGQRYLVFFGFFGPIDAGIYQQVVSVTPGSLYQFSCQAFAWSNCLDGKVPGSGLGCDSFPTDQAVFRAGIDPTGGTSYLSSNIVWGPDTIIYDAYAPVSVSATAAASVVTVYLRCTFRFAFQHNDAHVDALQLVEVGPRLEVTPTALNPSAWVGDPPAGDDTFTVTRTGGPGTINYTVSEEADWLTVWPTDGSSGGESDAITMSYDPTGLEAGEHVAPITVTAPGADDSPQTVTVTYTVLTVAPDFDGDADVDLSDFGYLQACLTGAGNPQDDPACRAARLDEDNDVDDQDFELLGGCLSGADVPADRNCMP